MAAEMQEAESETLFQKAVKANWDILDQLRTFMHCEEFSLFSQQASTEAGASVSPQTRAFVSTNELNYVSAVSALAAKVAEILHCAFKAETKIKI